MKLPVQVDVDELTISPDHREAPEDLVRELSEEIAKSGFVYPIIINSNMEIVAGVRRYKAVKLLGWKKIPAVIDDSGLVFMNL